MVSANTSTKQVLSGLKEGANDYIKKPFHQSELMMRIAAHIGTCDRFQTELHVRAPFPDFSGAAPVAVLVCDSPSSACPACLRAA